MAGGQIPHEHTQGWGSDIEATSDRMRGGEEVIARKQVTVYAQIPNPSHLGTATLIS